MLKIPTLFCLSLTTCGSAPAHGRAACMISSLESCMRHLAELKRLPLPREAHRARQD
jgi:hypothetical protein